MSALLTDFHLFWGRLAAIERWHSLKVQRTKGKVDNKVVRHRYLDGGLGGAAISGKAQRYLTSVCIPNAAGHRKDRLRLPR